MDRFKCYSLCGLDQGLQGPIGEKGGQGIPGDPGILGEKVSALPASSLFVLFVGLF